MSALDLFKLEGAVALVTGGSRGLGLEMATGLAEAGARVVLTARRDQWLSPAVQGLCERGFRCEGILCDVTQPDQVHACVERALTTFGHIDVLINNAGIAWSAPPEEMPIEQWRAVMDVNATGAFLMSQAVGRHMLERRSGRIINVSSITGLRGSRPEVLSAVSYHASKGAIIAMTMDLACRWAPFGIAVNAIAPGFFPTRMTEPLLRQREQTIISHVPMARLGRPDDIKGIAVFLASPAAAYVTGQVLVVDGGATAW